MENKSQRPIQEAAESDIEDELKTVKDIQNLLKKVFTVVKNVTNGKGVDERIAVFVWTEEKMRGCTAVVGCLMV